MSNPLCTVKRNKFYSAVLEVVPSAYQLLVEENYMDFLDNLLNHPKLCSLAASFVHYILSIYYDSTTYHQGQGISDNNFLDPDYTIPDINDCDKLLYS